MLREGILPDRIEASDEALESYEYFMNPPDPAAGDDALESSDDEDDDNDDDQQQQMINHAAEAV